MTYFFSDLMLREKERDQKHCAGTIVCNMLAMSLASISVITMFRNLRSDSNLT